MKITRPFLLCSLLTLLSIPIWAQSNIRFREDYSDNTNFWEESRTSNVVVSVGQGTYNILNNSSIDVLASRAFYIDGNRDYTITTAIKQVKAPKGGRVGLVWGMKDFDSYHAFEWRAGGDFIIYRVADKVFTAIKDYEATTALKAMGDWQQLVVERKGNKVLFKINGTTVYESTPQNYAGGKIGFIVSKGSQVEIDYLQVEQASDAPNLNPGFVFQSEKMRLASPVNSNLMEKTVAVSMDGNQLYFSRQAINEALGRERRTDIYVAEKSGNDWASVKALPSPVNNANYNSVFGFTSGGGLLIGETVLTTTTYDLRVGVSTLKNGSWSTLNAFNIPDFYSEQQEPSYSLSQDGQVLLISAERDDTNGGKDIYVSLQTNGQWAAPVNLGKTINTVADEVSVFLSASMDTLYFATQGHPGYGSFDIFYSIRQDKGWSNWSKPVNLGEKVNTSASEYGFTIEPNGQNAYFISNHGGNGAGDIFRIAMAKGMEMIAQNDNNDRPTLRSELTNAVAVPFKVVTSGIGSGNPEIEVVDKATGKVVGSYPVSNGQAMATLENGKVYVVRSKPGSPYFIPEKEIDLSGKPTSVAQQDLYALFTTEGNIVRLNKLLFPFNVVALQDASKPELDELAAFLKANPQVQAEVGGHADNVGSDAVNVRISGQRADAVIAYLTSKGVSRSQLTKKAYGESKPLNDNSTPELRDANRRVEFLVLDVQ